MEDFDLDMIDDTRQEELWDERKRLEALEDEETIIEYQDEAMDELAREERA